MSTNNDSGIAPVPGVVRSRQHLMAQGVEFLAPGAVHPSRPILGTFIHDIFSNPQFTRAFVNMLRQSKGLAPLSGPLPPARDRMEESYERPASMPAEYAGF
jgi:cobyric acid synthase